MAGYALQFEAAYVYYFSCGDLPQNWKDFNIKTAKFCLNKYEKSCFF